MEAIILAGGFGTRLRAVVSDVPKPMAPVAGRPFLALLLEHLQRRGFKRVILAVGYMHERIAQYFEAHPAPLELHFSIESEPMGTGGAIKLALAQATVDDVFVLNGDTFVPLEYREMRAKHSKHAATVTVALSLVEDCARFGAVELGDDGRIVAFGEKSRMGAGLVNAGVYVVNRRWAQQSWPSGQFSLERDVLLPDHEAARIYGFATEGEFLDIGTPQSYAEAERFLHLLST